MENNHSIAGYNGSNFSLKTLAFTEPQVRSMDLPTYLPYSYTCSSYPTITRVTYKN